jgi:hypothetical protein
MKQCVSQLMDQRLHRLGVGDIGTYSDDFLEEVAVADLIALLITDHLQAPVSP